MMALFLCSDTCLTDGVKVAQGSLKPLVVVRIHVSQPILFTYPPQVRILSHA